MLRNYMNEGGKVVFSGRNGWVQQTGTGTGLNRYSNYTWWQEPVYGFDYPPDQAGDDDRPHTAFFRELDISNDWAPVVARHRRRGRAAWARPRYNAARGQCRARAASSTGMAPIALDTRAGAGRHARADAERDDGRARAAAEGADAAAHISSITDRSGAFRQERVEADYAGRTTANGGAIISTRDSVVDRLRPGADHRRRRAQRARAAA